MANQNVEAFPNSESTFDRPASARHLDHSFGPSHQAALSIREFCWFCSVGRTTVYAEIKTGRLGIVKVGRRTLVPAYEVQAWLRRLANNSGRHREAGAVEK